MYATAGRSRAVLYGELGRRTTLPKSVETAR